MLVMEARSDRSHELERQLERRMRAQERQLAWVRLGMVALAAAVLLIVAPTMPGIEILFALLGVVAAWSVLVFWLLRRFPAREVGIISTVVEMAAVTIAVYVAVDADDLYLLYGLVILGAALRFGLGAAVWSSLVMTGMYLAVVLPGDRLDPGSLEALPVRIAQWCGARDAVGTGHRREPPHGFRSLLRAERGGEENLISG